MGAYLPYLNGLKKAREMTGAFGGYNHNPKIASSDFYDMRNLGGQSYPLLAPRIKRGRVRQLGKPNGLYAHDKLCWVDGASFFYDGKLIGSVRDGKKQFVSMGAYILIFPDKVFYNTSTGEFGSLEALFEATQEVKAVLSRLDASAYGDPVVSETAPEEPTDGQLWIDTSSTPHVLKMYSNYQASWASVPTTYVKISSPGIGKDFAQYDGVMLEGFEDENLNGQFVLYDVGPDYILVTALIEKTITQIGGIRVERIVPDMDFVTESENRVWGCSSATHEIYACALGEPKVWNRFLGISTDSYVATVGSAGAFTGCATHLGYVLFFKEHVIHKVYGSKPSNFQLTNTVCRGVQQGSEKSLCIVNETLLYKSVFDVCAYGSALPESVSDALGGETYRNAAAGAVGSDYYVCMRDEKGVPTLFVYDTEHRLWHKQDHADIDEFARVDDELYFVDKRDNCLYSARGSMSRYADDGACLEGDFEWFAQSGDIGLEQPDGKYVSMIQIRIEADANTTVRVSVQFDDQEAWIEQYRLNFTHKRSFVVPIVPRRCDHMRIRLDGEGACKVWSICKTIEYGGV